MFGRSGETKYKNVASEDIVDDHDIENEGDAYVDHHRQRQQELMGKQDEGLEMLAQSAQRLGQMSENIHEELAYQNQVLEDIENDLDDATDNLDMVTRRTKEMIKKAGGKQNFMIILCLCAVVIVLILLVIYT